VKNAPFTKLASSNISDDPAGKPSGADISVCEIDSGVRVCPHSRKRCASLISPSFRFLPPKIFTNALLNDHEITTMIRDTEPHERSLFSVDPSAVNRNRSQNIAQSALAENGTYGRKSIFPTAQPVKQSAITRLLGSEMLQEIRLSSRNTARSRDSVNVEVLLRGAEKLCDVYAVPGAPEKIRALRNRHREVAASISLFEERVSRQQSLLDRRNKGLEADDDDSKENQHNDHLMSRIDDVTFTERDFQIEENEIRELEARKKALEERVSGMERDLGGLLS